MALNRPNRLNRIRVEETASPAHEEVIEKMVNDLPSELTDEQREKVRKLLTQYRTILSTGTTMSDGLILSNIPSTQLTTDPCDSR